MYIVGQLPSGDFKRHRLSVCLGNSQNVPNDPGSIFKVQARQYATRFQYRR